MVYFLNFLLIIIQIFNRNSQNLEEKRGLLKFPFNTKMRVFSPDELLDYNETNFINDFLHNTIFINVSIGTPKQKIKIMIDQNEPCFTFLQNKKSIEFNDMNNSDYNYMTPYNRNNSSTSKHISSYDTKNNIDEIEDIFYLFEHSDTKNITIKNSSNFVNFLYRADDEIEDNIYLKIGLDMNNYKNAYYCPRFFNYVKEQNLINKYIFYFDFYTHFHGYFCLGAEPHIYDKANNNYNDYQYLKINTELSKDGYINWQVLFNKIIIINQTNDYTYNLNEKMVQIDFNSFLIIGTNEYQQYIEENFFNELIKIKICNKTLVEYFYDNKISKYYVYKCNKTLMNGDNFDWEKYPPYVNYFEIFPEFQLFHVNLEHNFFISKYDLFKLIHGNYYFLIIFEAEKTNKVWKFGQILLRNHQLFFDYDSKTIGYYDRRIEPPKNKSDDKKSDDNKDENTDQNQDKNNNDNGSNKNNIQNKKKSKIYIYIIIFIAFCAVVSLAFYLGMKFKQSRKKRANELKDDNYEYLTDDLNDDSKNKIINS